MSDKPRYDAGSRAFHWLGFLAIAAAFGIAWVMEALPFSPLRLKLFNWHKWVGVTVLVLTVLRLLWRLGHKAPEPVAMPRWQSLAAKATHLALYPLIIAQSLLGWAHSNAAGYPIVWFGKLRLPDLVAKDKALADLTGEWHEAVAWALLALIAAHVLAALKHHLVDRDDTLRRMLPH